jgi:serine/threonine protein kinase
MITPRSVPEAYDKRIVSIGGSAIVSLYDTTTVLKGTVVVLDGRITYVHDFEPEASHRSLDLEYRVYQRLGRHQNILKCFGWVIDGANNTRSLQLEFASKGSFRDLISANKPIGISLQFAWAEGPATGQAYMHSRGVNHCDFSCRNVFVTEQNIVKIGDFGGAGLDGEESDGVEEARYELPLRDRQGDRPCLKRDLFALGSAIYEVMAWRQPFTELTDEEVGHRFTCNEFPDLSNVLCGHVIQKCWEEKFDRAEDVLEAIRICNRF